MSIFLTGCESKKQVEIVRRKIPPSLLEIPYVDTNRSVKTDAEIGLFMLDLFEGYGKCVIQLEKIKRINDE